jgi:hypothetical protein
MPPVSTRLDVPQRGGAVWGERIDGNAPGFVPRTPNDDAGDCVFGQRQGGGRGAGAGERKNHAVGGDRRGPRFTTPV